MKKLLPTLFLTVLGLLNTVFAQSVVVFTDTHFTGKNQTLRAGNYLTADLTVGDNAISSLKLPEGFKAIAFENDNFEGDFFEITVSLTSLDFWAGRISSIKVIDLANRDIPVDNKPVINTEPITNNGGNTNNSPSNDAWWNKKATSANYSPNDIVIFANKDFQGTGQVLVEGRYNDTDLSIGNDEVSSIKIPQGYTVRLFENGGFDGSFIDLKSEVSDLNSIRWDNRVSSIQVFKGNASNTTISTGNSVLLYQHGNYGGRNQSLGAGKYTSRDFGLAQDLTSLRVAQGFYVRLYEQDNFQGNSVDVSNDASDLSDIGWNDKVMSLEIIRGISPTQSFNNNNSNWNNNSGFNNNANNIGANQVVIYQNSNYNGRMQALTEGDYPTLRNLNVRNYDVSSIRVPVGFAVRLYSRENGQGSFVDITQDVPNLSNMGWDNRAMSMQIIRSTNNTNNNNNGLPGASSNTGLYSNLNRSYRMTQNNIDYRIRIANSNGQTQIQTQSGFNSWVLMQVVSIDNQRGSYRIRDNNNNEFDILLQRNGSSLTLSNRNNSWSYMAE